MREIVNDPETEALERENLFPMMPVKKQLI